VVDASDLNQLTVILILATVLFIITSALPQKIGTIVLLILLPIQVIETRFGTSSVVIAYVVFIALLLRKEPVRLPMLPHILFLLLWYLISMSLMLPSTYMQHGVYIFTLISAVLVFWLCYDLTRRFENPLGIVDVFVAMNVLVAGYSIFQIWLGPGERFVFFGIDELNMTMVREDGRLTGPFQSAEISAQYFVLMMFLILHQIWHTPVAWYKRALVGLAVVNLACLIATGSRGEFLLLIGGSGLYLWLFRRHLGIVKATKLAVGGAISLVATAMIVVNFTQFGGLFERLEETEFSQSGIPDTRQVLWPPAWREIVRQPVVGHGPRFRFFMEDFGVRYEDHKYIRYPHNLYLFLLYTVGAPGLVLFLGFFITIIVRCARSMSQPNAPPYFADLARMGLLMLVLFLVDGLKIEQMRLGLADYWHFIFGLCGVLVAACATIDRSSAVAVVQEHDAADQGSHDDPGP